MTGETKSNLRRLARTAATQAVVALVVGGCLTVYGTTVKAQGVASVNKARKQDRDMETSASSNAATKQGKVIGAGTSISEPRRASRAIEQNTYANEASSQGASDAAETDSNEARKEGKLTPAAFGGHHTDPMFRDGPQYKARYDAQGQVDIYGAKTAVEPPRPPIELGRQQYTSGAYEKEDSLFGEKNLLIPGLAVYGDWRTAVAYNQNNGKDIAQIATRLNIDVDFKITGTERIHAFFTPLQDNAQFTRFEFGGGDGDKRFNGEFDLNPQTLFFEGDAGSIYSGFSGNEASFDLPFTVGLFPLFLQNGIWANDAILGGAVSIPAKNSASLGLSNFDVTFFAAVDNVDNAGILGKNEEDNHNANVYGVTAFIDAFSGYIETGYGLIQGRDDAVDGDLTHFVTAAYTRRYANTLSNSTRVFANFGDGEGDEGVAIISENSLISGLPSTLLPYANFFVGFNNPQPLVDGNGAGILKNVGINFETDALTGYPKLNDTGSNAFGGAIGLQYLFDLDQQLVFELATVQPFGDVVPGIGVADPQYAFGVRYQIPLDKAWLFRADATYQITEGVDDDNFGIRAEVRRKF
jgi:hypothetical protein